MRTDETGAIPYEKSNNVETSLFRTQGRITRKAFFLRLLLCVIIWLVFHVVYVRFAEVRYQDCLEMGNGKIQEGCRNVETFYKIWRIIDFYIVSPLLAVFLLIQAIKRAHDVNKSGWSIMIPFYNIYILLSKGTNDDNDFGLLPHSEKKSPSYQYEETGPN